MFFRRADVFVRAVSFCPIPHPYRVRGWGLFVMNHLPWFKFFPADWLKGTRAFSPLRKGIWIDLLAYGWESKIQGSIETDWESLARLCGVDRLTIESEIIGMNRDEILNLFCGECGAAYARCNASCNARCNASVTLLLRRMYAECNARELERQKKQKQRESANLRIKAWREKNCPRNVPDKKSEVRSQYKDKDICAEALSSSQAELHLKDEHRRPPPFTKPTLEEVEAYCRKRGNKVDPIAFLAHYESNGWRVGRNPMQNWKAAVVTWEKRRENDVAPQQPRGRTIRPAHEVLEEAERLGQL